MSDSPPTSEIESLIHGYVEGKLTPVECIRFRELLDAHPGCITTILECLRSDALIRRTVLEAGGVTPNLAPHPAAAGDKNEASAPGSRGSRRFRRAVGLAIAACLLLLLVWAALRLGSPWRKTIPASKTSVGSGSILYEYWTEIPGSSVRDLTSHPAFQRDPTARTLLPQFEAASSQRQNYGARVRGYLYPPGTGDYQFWIASDDASELWLSTNEQPANKKQICFVETWAPPREWSWNASQQSPAIRLEAGKHYYIEALHKQGGAGDSLAVAWQTPGGTREIIPGRFLSPISTTAPGTLPARAGPPP